MEQSPSWEANHFSASQESPRNSRNPQFHYRIPNSPPPVPTLSQLDPVPTKVSVPIRGRSSCFITRPVFTARSCQHLAQPPSWRTTPCLLSATIYSIYSQLPYISEAVPPSATWRRAIRWWQRLAYHGFTDTQFLNHSLKTRADESRNTSEFSFKQRGLVCESWRTECWFDAGNVNMSMRHGRCNTEVPVCLSVSANCACDRLTASQYVCVLVGPRAANWFLFEWECSPYS